MVNYITIKERPRLLLELDRKVYTTHGERKRLLAQHGGYVDSLWRIKNFFWRESFVVPTLTELKNNR
jgi:hypothetical protein